MCRLVSHPAPRKPVRSASRIDASSLYTQHAITFWLRRRRLQSRKLARRVRIWSNVNIVIRTHTHKHTRFASSVWRKPFNHNDCVTPITNYTPHTNKIENNERAPPHTRFAYSFYTVSSRCGAKNMDIKLPVLVWRLLVVLFARSRLFMYALSSVFIPHAHHACM